MNLRSQLLSLLQKLPPRAQWSVMAFLRPPVHFGDDVAVWKRRPPFTGDRRFEEAFVASTSFASEQVRQMDIRWRAYVCCWAARQALLTEGDFVECGVNTGVIAGTICRYLDFARLQRGFFLFDTYQGIPVDLARGAEQGRVHMYNQQYPDVWEVARANFHDFPNATLVRGRVPDTLPDSGVQKVAYLSIDMNIVAPERAALEYFWPILSPGGIVVLDDYGFIAHEQQRLSADEFADAVGVPILPLPTGQGLLVKPHTAMGR